MNRLVFVPIAAAASISHGQAVSVDFVGTVFRNEHTSGPFAGFQVGDPAEFHTAVLKGASPIATGPDWAEYMPITAAVQYIAGSPFFSSPAFASALTVYVQDTAAGEDVYEIYGKIGGVSQSFDFHLSLIDVDGDALASTALPLSGDLNPVLFETAVGTIYSDTGEELNFTIEQIVPAAPTLGPILAGLIALAHRRR